MHTKSEASVSSCTLNCQDFGFISFIALTIGLALVTAQGNNMVIARAITLVGPSSRYVFYI